jgi:AcrR family transcriptional regulator
MVRASGAVALQALRSGPRRPNQRERLLAALIPLVGRDGYQALTVSRLTTLAGVSRSSFYEHFSDREGCLLAALERIYAALEIEVQAAIDAERPNRAGGAAARALVNFAEREPVLARVAMGESLAAGRGCLRARDEMIAGLAAAVEEAYRRAPGAALAPDLPSAMLLGAVTRMLAARLNRGEPAGLVLCGELDSALRGYRRPLREHRCRALTPLAEPARSPYLPLGGLRAPGPPARQCARAPQEQASEQQRLRIMFATADVASRAGFQAATVTAITREAGLDPRCFYRHFPDKSDALRHAGDLLFGHLVAVAAGAFVIGETWPERAWEAARALAQCAQQNRALVAALLVEGPAAGMTARLQEVIDAFALFLQDGYRSKGSRAGPPDLALELIAASVFELGYAVARAGEGREFPGLLAHVVFIALAPFLGAAAANRFLSSRRGEAAEACPKDVVPSTPLPPCARHAGALI